VYQYLIETKGCDINVQDNYNNIPLILALLYFKGGNITVLMYLLSQGNINANIKGQCGHTILHYACEKINKLPLEIFKLLIETHGADVNAQNDNKDTPLHRAVRRFNPDVGGNITTLTYLLSQKDVNCNIKGSFGCTLLHTACEQINTLPLDVFKLLIEILGCDVNVHNNHKNTPLHLAFHAFDPHYGDDITIFAYLINENNANVNIKDQKGFNSLHLACISNLSESRDSVELNAECDTTLCQIVEFIVEACLFQILDETTP
jgi:cytohesin